MWGAIFCYRTGELQFLNTGLVLETAFLYLKNLFGTLHDMIKYRFTLPGCLSLGSKNKTSLYAVTCHQCKEKMWGWLTRKFFESGRQYSSKKELVKRIKNGWSLNY